MSDGQATTARRAGWRSSDQRGQHVVYQYNVAGTINFGAVQQVANLAGHLRALKAEVAEAASKQALDEEVATDVEYHLTKAVQQAEKPAPAKATLLDHLTKAKEVMETTGTAAGAATGLITGLSGTIAAVQKVFGG